MKTENTVLEKSINEENKNLIAKEESNVISIHNAIFSTFGIFFILILVFMAISIILFSIFCVINSYNTNIIAGVYIQGINVSGMNKQEAKKTLENSLINNLPENIKLKYNDYETYISLDSLDVDFNIEDSVNIAYSLGRNGNIFKSNLETLKIMFSNININPGISINENQLKNSLEDISSNIPDALIESGYYIDSNNLVITKGKSGHIVDINTMLSYIKYKIQNSDFTNNTIELIVTNKEPTPINIEEIHNEIYKEPINAYYTQNPYSLYPHEDGLNFAVSIDEAKQILTEDKEEYIIPLKILSPEITTNMIGSEAFPDLISSFSTKYPISNKNRTTNLILASSKINGTVLMPGETFSYNKVVGERTISAGYKEAAIYVDGKVVDGLGGGICQITTTLYNAVLYANLEIVERRNHQFVPSYVTAGRDATVVYGLTDFKFKNSRNYPIKILCSVSGGIAKFEILGLKTDNEYEVIISSKVTKTTSSAIYSQTYKTLKQNGNTISSEILSNDVYKRH